MDEEMTGIWMTEQAIPRNKSKMFRLLEMKSFQSGKWPVMRIPSSTSNAKVKLSSMVSERR